MATIDQVEPNVDRISLVDARTGEKKEIYLVGTAHISKSSVELAERIIRQVRPDAVAVELCEPRLQSLKNPDRWRDMDLLNVFRQGKALVLLAQLALASFQRKLGDQLEVKPGSEMIRAVEVAEEVGSSLVLADREVRITLKRIWTSLSFWGMCKLLNTIVLGLFQKHTITNEEIERLKSNDALHSALEEFSEAFPTVKRTLIAERDLYLASRIRTAPGATIVAIIGAGHCPGIKSHIEDDINIKVLEEVPRPGFSRVAFKWGLPVLLIGLVVYAVSTAGYGLAGRYLWLWSVVTAFYAALGCLITLTHPVTALFTVLTAPFTMLVPIFKPGLVAAVFETYIRRPRVADMETVLEDMAVFRGWYTNRVAHVFLIFIVNNLTKWPAVGTLGLLGLSGMAG